MDKGKTTRMISGGVRIGKDGKPHKWSKIHGYKAQKVTDDNWMEYGMPDDEDNNVSNESRNMKRTIRLRESELRRMISETVKSVLMEARKPNDRMIGRHKFKGEYYDRNGNPIYTHPSRLDDPEGGTLSDDFLKDYGWRYSKKRGLHGQISDPTRFPK